MAIAALFNIPASDEELAQWSFAHAAHHYDIVRRIYEVYKIALPQFVLDPFQPYDPHGTENWSYYHQLMHQNQNIVLGINGFDLLDVDWQDQGQVAGWIQLNANEHVQAANILGVA